MFVTDRDDWGRLRGSIRSSGDERTQRDGGGGHGGLHGPGGAHYSAGVPKISCYLQNRCMVNWRRGWAVKDTGN